MLLTKHIGPEITPNMLAFHTIMPIIMAYLCMIYAIMPAFYMILVAALWAAKGPKVAAFLLQMWWFWCSKSKNSIKSKMCTFATYNGRHR